MFFVTIPHSGRQIPPEAGWLKSLPPSVLYCDIDAFVDDLYEIALKDLQIPSLIFPWHRYAVDANRLPEHICAQTVQGAKQECRRMDLIGLHWKKTTKEDELMHEPLTQELHKIFVDKYYKKFHQSIKDQFKKMKDQNNSPVYHLDLHSMPSLGKKIHKDPGEKRAEVVIGNRNGKSARTEFTDSVVKAYKESGFQVKLNWPYQGGSITESYGQPLNNQHTIQVELNRDLYMHEESGLKKDNFSDLQIRFKKALTSIQKDLKNLS